MKKFLIAMLIFISIALIEYIAFGLYITRTR